MPTFQCGHPPDQPEPLQYRHNPDRHNVHLLRNSFRYASKKDWSAIAKDLRPVYTAPTEAAALKRFIEFSDTWQDRYPAITKLWEHAWTEFVPFLNFDPQDPHGDLYDQRDREPERAVPSGGQGAWALPE
jgi:putative transposase